MSGNIILIVEGQVKSGSLDDFKAQIKTLVDTTKADEPDTLIYECYLADDNVNFEIYERYRDSAATVVHLKIFMENFAQAFQTVADTTKVTVYGSPDDAVKQILDGFGAVYVALISGFQR
jgi:quinol monooxygenase YgiN